MLLGGIWGAGSLTQVPVTAWQEEQRKGLHQHSTEQVPAATNDGQGLFCVNNGTTRFSITCYIIHMLVLYRFVQVLLSTTGRADHKANLDR